ncbi:metallophosphoesterase [Rhodobacterales bacterium HKCCE3408]|nr:metallophosphoesterase [Rhodobacterales bacterium HKCCE3408]
MTAPARRIAVIADIHGNADALNAVLARIDAAGADLIVNLGDHFSGPLDAVRTAEILRTRPEIVSIRGNHDRWLIEQDPAEMAPSDASAHAQLSAEDLRWLRSLPPLHRIDDVLLCHATPKDDLTYWMETVTPEGAVTLRPADEIERLARGESAALMLCGHTHVPRGVRLTSGALIVNPGSVGCPAFDDDHPVPHAVEAGLPDARFAIVERFGDDWTVAFHAVPYDTARMAQMAEAAGRRDWAKAVARGRVRP